ncbi:hypothetical protein C8F04DRAFT_1063143 [Mycena alexandri]|uniref:Uncharacterized protein n=1 Tax=Mycena alexandri TaxID=1745969 RepID=A0AAD6TJA7_9AGAR|nr:hypothetical protein C8F04DRAFT_1063143 [Mycena alexandri]
MASSSRLGPTRGQSYPHAPNLLRNRNPDLPLTSFDGRVGALAQIGAEHYFITTNVNYIPALPSIEKPHKLYLRSDMRYGTDDPMLWPQQYTPKYCHMAVIPSKGARPDLDVMWWNPSVQEDFIVGSAVTRGLGRLPRPRFSAFLPAVNDLVRRCTELKRTSPQLVIPLFGDLIQYILMWVEQLETLPTTFPKMVFAVTSLQRAVLELEALYRYMTVCKPRMDNYLAFSGGAEIAQCVGAFTSSVMHAQQLSAAGIPFWLIRPLDVFDRENILEIVPLLEPHFGLPDDNAHAASAPPALYTGNSTEEKIGAIQRAAIQTPWYHDPFETNFGRDRSPSPSPNPVASSSSLVPRAHSSLTKPITPSRSAAVRQPPPRQNPYSTAGRNKAPSSNKGPAKTPRNKFSALMVPEMPPSIASMADALARVDQGVVPYSTDSSDRRYIFPEPALLVNTPYADRRNKLLHHWMLLADGFTYMLTQHPDPPLLSGQQWRDILEGLITKRGAVDSRVYRRSDSLEDRIRPALEACNLPNLTNFPAPAHEIREFTLSETQEIVWQVAETNFRFEFVSLDKRASTRKRLAEVKECFAGHMLVGMPLEISKLGWASTSLKERHVYVVRTATLMLDWTTKSACPSIIRRVADRRPWSQGEMEALEIAVCQYYTQAFWEYFGRAAVVPLRLDHDLEKEEGEL